jgi:hypothetical protein
LRRSKRSLVLAIKLSTNSYESQNSWGVFKQTSLFLTDLLVSLLCLLLGHTHGAGYNWPMRGLCCGLRQEATRVGNGGTRKGGIPRESCSQNYRQLICFWVGKQWRNVLQGSSIQTNIAVSPINRTTVEWAVICDGAPTYHRAFREMKDRWGDD